MGRPEDDSFHEDVRAIIQNWIESDLVLFLSELGFFDDYSPNLIAQRVNRLSPEQMTFLLQRLEWEGETPESRKKLLREHLGLSSEIEDEFRAKILDIIPE